MKRLSDQKFDGISKALADPQRRKILERLAATTKYLNHSEISSVFKISPPTVSHHLRELTSAGLVERQRSGQFFLYRFNREVLSPYVNELRRRMVLDT